MKKRGFTLIELIVAVFITSIVVIAAYSLMTGSTQGFQDQNDRRILDANLRNAELILQRDFSRVGYHAPFDKVGTSVKTCVSGSTSVQFNALYVDYDANTKAASVNFIADLTDYDGFIVKTYTDGVIGFEQAMQLPLAAVNFGTQGDEPAREFITNENDFNAIYDRAFKHAYAAYITSPENKGIFTTWDFTNKTIEPCSSLADYGFSATEPFIGDSVFPVLMVNYHVDDGNLLRCYGDPFDNKARYNSDTCEILLRNVKRFKVFPITAANPIVKCEDTPTSTILGVALKDVIGLAFCLAVASENIASTPNGTNSNEEGPFLSSPVWYDSNNKGHAFGTAYGTAMIKNRNAEWIALDNDIKLNTKTFSD